MLSGLFRDSKGDHTNNQARAIEINFQMVKQFPGHRVPALWHKAKANNTAAALQAVNATAASFSEPGPSAAESDALDELAAAERDQWKPVMDSLVDPLRKLFADAKAQGLTAGQLLDQLAEQLPDMNADPLADSLSRAAMAARLAGDAGIDNE